MCGIWATFGTDGRLNGACVKCFSAIVHRGPDAWRLEQDAREPLAVFGFQRLVIVDGLNGMQPMRLHLYPRVSLICNGEIYNCERLCNQYKFQYETHCDIEAIIHCYKKFGISDTVRNLDGVFAFCLIDGEKRKIYIARDPYGVRPLFQLQDEKKDIWLSVQKLKA